MTDPQPGDEPVEELKQFLRLLRETREGQAFGDLVAGWDRSPSSEPGSEIWPYHCHPFYRGRYQAMLRPWLNRQGPFAKQDVLMLPILQGFRTMYAESGRPGPPSPSGRLQLRRRKCAWEAPSVGPRRYYVWFSAVDGLGRTVNGDVIDVLVRRP